MKPGERPGPSRLPIPPASIPLALKKPQPEVLLARAVPVTRVKTATKSHVHCLPLRKWSAEPSVIGLGFKRTVTLNLELEERARPQQALHFADIVFDDLPARNVLEHDGGKRKVELQVRHHRQILAIVLIDGRPRKITQGFGSQPDHFAADIDCMHLAAKLVHSPGHASSATAD